MTASQRRRDRLAQVASDKLEQGHDVGTVVDRLHSARDDDLDAIAAALPTAPLRAGWSYVEPNDLAGIRRESHPSRSVQPLASVPVDEAAGRIRAGFLGSVCGCILGKPVEFDPTMDELRAALIAIGEWPLDDYISERLVGQGGLRRFHADWPETVRERIRWVAPDDDINYTIIGMLALERHGRALSQADLARLWLASLPVGWTYGPERTMLVRFAAASLGNHELEVSDVEQLADVENPGDERCGAMIRADAYGYALPGDPETASELAWRDASLTHRRTGIYGSMFVAAAIATSFVVDDPMEVAKVALQYVPSNSRFAVAAADCMSEVGQAHDWQDGYERIHRKYGNYGHCRVFQETGTLLNTMRFAKSVGHGICLQVSQGNDTDSYGATAGALLGVRFGMAGLADRWLVPFNDRLHTTVATLHEPSLSAVADRMSDLPRAVAEWRSPAEDQRMPGDSVGWMG